MACQYRTTFMRELGPWDTEGLWGARPSQLVLHASRPILLSKLLGATRPTLPAHFGQLPLRHLEQLRVVIAVVHFTLLGTLALQTDLQRRNPLGPYVPSSGFDDLVALPIWSIRNVAGDADTNTEKDAPESREDVASTDPAATAAAAGRAAMVAELASLMQMLALGRDYDADRMVALITAL
eukprot:6182294-Pleurochrysis_carterae.AAC.2